MSEAAPVDRRKINWTLVIALFGWGGFGLVAWGSTTAQVNAHDKRLDRLETSYVSDKDMAAIGLRLTRIEGELVEMNRYFRRPQP